MPFEQPTQAPSVFPYRLQSVKMSEKCQIAPPKTHGHVCPDAIVYWRNIGAYLGMLTGFIFGCDANSVSAQATTDGNSSNASHLRRFLGLKILA